VKVVTIRDKTRQQNVARFIGFPPTPPCILILFHAIEARHFGLNSEEEDGWDSAILQGMQGRQIWDCQMIWPAGKDAEACFI